LTKRLVLLDIVVLFLVEVPWLAVPAYLAATQVPYRQVAAISLPHGCGPRMCLFCGPSPLGPDSARGRVPRASLRTVESRSSLLWHTSGPSSTTVLWTLIRCIFGRESRPGSNTPSPKFFFTSSRQPSCIFRYARPSLEGGPFLSDKLLRCLFSRWSLFGPATSRTPRWMLSVLFLRTLGIRSISSNMPHLLLCFIWQSGPAVEAADICRAKTFRAALTIVMPRKGLVP
jgi:hypothetical protein